jgi:hypothetical protein
MLFHSMTSEGHVIVEGNTGIASELGPVLVPRAARSLSMTGTICSTRVGDFGQALR